MSGLGRVRDFDASDLVVAVNPACYRWGTTIDEFIEASRTAGFTEVEISIQQGVAWSRELGGAEALADELRSRRVRVVQFSGIIPDGPVLPAPLLCPSSEWADALATIADRLEVAAAVGCPSAAVVVDPVVTASRDEAEREARRRLQRLAEWATSFDIHLSVEFLGTGRFAHSPDARAFVTDLPSLMVLLEPLPEDSVRVLLDVFHWYASDPNLTTLDIAAGRIGFVQVSDVPASRDVSRLEDSMRVLPGDGDMSFSHVSDALRAAGYEGPWSLELFSQDLWDQEPVDAARRLFCASRTLRQSVAAR